VTTLSSSNLGTRIPYDESAVTDPIVSSSLLDKLPVYAATEEIRREEEIQITDDTVREYDLQVTPYNAVDHVAVNDGGVPRELDVGNGVEEVTRNGELRAIRFDANIDLREGDTATVYYLTNPTLQRYAGSYEDDLSSAMLGTSFVRTTRYVDSAEGQALDFIGSWFGEVGERRGRSDAEYRTFLRSIVRAFNGTGTRHDMRLVISGAVRGKIKDITIDEDFQKNGFRVTITEGDDAQISSAINEVVEMARPSGVELLDEPIIVSEGAKAEVTIPGAEVVRTGVGLGSDEIGATEIGALDWDGPADPQS